MKIYKNCLKKFVQVCEHQRPKSDNLETVESVSINGKSAKNIGGSLQISTPLPHSFLQYVMLFLLALAAVCLLNQLDIPKIYAVSSSTIIALIYIFDALKSIKNRKNLQSLQCFNHVWTLNYLDGSQEVIEIQSISQGLGFMYALNFLSQENAKDIQIDIWKYQSEANFLSYCSQLCIIGKKD